MENPIQKNERESETLGKEYQNFDFDIETILAFLISCSKTGKPTLREIILYLQRKMETDEAMKLPTVDIERKKT